MLLLGVVVHRGGPRKVDHRDDHLGLGLQSPQRNSLDHAGLLLPVKNELGPESPDADAALVAAAAAASGVQQFEARLADAFEERRFADWNADLKKVKKQFLKILVASLGRTYLGCKGFLSITWSK